MTLNTASEDETYLLGWMYLDIEFRESIVLGMTDLEYLDHLDKCRNGAN